MAESGESPRLSDELGPVDYLMHRGEANPRTRSGIMALELLDGTPDWDRFRTRFENASRRVLRLRQKVVVPTLPTAAPRWVVDPDFNLDFHVRRVRVSGPATLREVLDLAEVILQSPLDISRPLWTATLVEGMADGRAAMLLHVSHAVTDGVGGVEMFAQIYDLERDPPPRSTPPQPIPEDLSPNDLMRRGINHLPIAVVGGVLDALSGAVSMAGRAVLEPVSTVSGILGYARSGIRVLNRAAEPSPLLRQFTGVNLAAPVGTIDPVARMKKIRAQMTQRRDEPAMNIIGSIAPVLSVLPTAVLEGITGSVIGSDVQASNVPVYPGDTYLAGAKILRQYGNGPLPGVAMMVVLISRGGWCTVTVRYDRASVRNDELFAQCLQAGFDEILALAGDPAPRVLPASFDTQGAGSVPRSVSGS